jgi:hypothetical protein
MFTGIGTTLLVEKKLLFSIKSVLGGAEIGLGDDYYYRNNNPPVDRDLSFKTHGSKHTPCCKFLYPGI